MPFMHRNEHTEYTYADRMPQCRGLPRSRSHFVSYQLNVTTEIASAPLLPADKQAAYRMFIIHTQQYVVWYDGAKCML